jgi:hypothetical protein
MSWSPRAAAAKYVVLRYIEFNFPTVLLILRKIKFEVFVQLVKVLGMSYLISILVPFTPYAERYVTTTYTEIGRKAPLDLFIASKL